MIYFLQGYLVVLLEAFCCKIFFEIFCSVEEKQPKMRQMGMPLLLSFLLFAGAVVFSAHFGIKEVVLILIVTFVMKYYNGQTLKKNVVLTIIFQSIVLIVDYVAVIFTADYIYEVEITSYLVQSLVVILAKSILFLVIMLIRNIFAKKEMKYFNDENWLKFLFFPIFTLCIIIALLSNSSLILEEKQQQLYWMIAFGLVGMNMVVFYLVNDVALTQKKIHEKEMFEIQATTQMRLYATILEDTERQRKMSHEYRNQIECIQTLCETAQYEALKEYLQKITGKVLHDMDLINTNHAMVNAVLNAKYQEAMKRGIVVVYKVSDMSKLRIDSQDMVLLLSNLLNNAIEACDKCLGAKSIKLKLVLEDANLILSVKNTYNGHINYKNGVIQTTKKRDSKNHGIGIQNIIQVVEKYKGYYVIEPKKEQFYISIMIPQSGMQ